MEYFISAIWIGIELLCNIFFCGAFLAQKERSNIKVLVVVIVWIIIGLYSNLGINPLARQVVTVLLYTFISFLLYKGSYIAHILLALICYIFIATIDTIAVNDLSSIPYQTDEFVVLLSNLLDNAIEACLRTDRQREILCSILKEDGVYISIRNTSEPVAIVNGGIATSKPNTAEHGFGLPAVKYILERLGAEYTFAYKDGWFRFVAEIPL